LDLCTRFSIMRILISLIVCVWITEVSAQIASYFSSTEARALFTKSQQLVSTSNSLKEIYYAVNYLESSGLGTYGCQCDSLQSLVNQAATGYDIFYGMSASSICNCGTKTPDSYTSITQKSLQSSNLYDIAGGVLASQVMGTLTTDDKGVATNKMMALMASDGTFKMNPDDSQSSIENLHYALELLAATTTDTDASDFAADVFEKAFNMIPSGDGESASDALLMVPLSKLTDKKLRLVGTRLVIVTEILLSMKHMDDIVILSKVYNAFRIIASYKATPLCIGCAKTFFDASDPASHILNLSVLDVFGVDAPVESAEVVSVKNVGKDTILFQGQTFTSGGLDMSSANLQSGRYIVHLSITVTGRPKPIPFQSYIVVTDKVVVSNVHYLVSDADDVTSSDLQAVSTQNSITDVSANALSGDKIYVEFTVSSESLSDKTKKPHQSFVRLTHTDTGNSVYYAAKKSTAGATASAMEYSVTCSVGEDIEKFNYLSGTYTLAILVGDAAYSSPVEWVLGGVDLRFPGKQATNLPLYAKSLLHASDTTMKPLPEITHVMRPPAKRASSFMAALFTGLTWLPLVVFVAVLLSLRPDLKRLTSLPNLAALACFGGILTLYVSYWLSLEGASFYETIKYLCVLSPLMVVLGRYCLLSVTSMRQKETESKEKQT